METTNFIKDRVCLCFYGGMDALYFQLYFQEEDYGMVKVTLMTSHSVGTVKNCNMWIWGVPTRTVIQTYVCKCTE